MAENKRTTLGAFLTSFHGSVLAHSPRTLPSLAEHKRRRRHRKVLKARASKIQVMPHLPWLVSVQVDIASSQFEWAETLLCQMRCLSILQIKLLWQQPYASTTIPPRLEKELKMKEWKWRERERKREKAARWIIGDLSGNMLTFSFPIWCFPDSHPVARCFIGSCYSIDSDHTQRQSILTRYQKLHVWRNI